MYRTGWEDWLDAASCRTVDPEIFFADTTDEKSRRQIKEARDICGSCLVMNECLDYAIQNKIPYGIFGGLDPEERNKVSRLRDYVANLSA